MQRTLLLLGAGPPQKFGTNTSILLTKPSLYLYILGQDGTHQITISQLNEQIETLLIIQDLQDPAQDPLP